MVLTGPVARGTSVRDLRMRPRVRAVWCAAPPAGPPARRSDAARRGTCAVSHGHSRSEPPVLQSTSKRLTDALITLKLTSKA